MGITNDNRTILRNSFESIGMSKYRRTQFKIYPYLNPFCLLSLNVPHSFPGAIGLDLFDFFFLLGLFNQLSCLCCLMMLPHHLGRFRARHYLSTSE